MWYRVPYVDSLNWKLFLVLLWLSIGILLIFWHCNGCCAVSYKLLSLGWPFHISNFPLIVIFKTVPTSKLNTCLRPARSPSSFCAASTLCGSRISRASRKKETEGEEKRYDSNNYFRRNSVSQSPMVWKSFHRSPNAALTIPWALKHLNHMWSKVRVRAELSHFSSR